MPPSPPKKKPVVDDGFSSAFDQAVAPVLPKSSASVGVVKDDSFSAAFDAALSKKKVGTADAGIGANTTSSPSPSSSEVQSPSTNIDVPKQYDISTLNGVIKPQGTFVPENHKPTEDLLAKITNSVPKGEVNVSPSSNTEKQDKAIAIRDEAITNTALENLKRKRGVYDKTLPPPTTDEINTEKQFVNRAYENNDIVPVKEGDKVVMKRTAGFSGSILKGINEAYKNTQENDYFASLSKDEKIKYLNLRQQYPDAYEKPDDTVVGSQIMGVDLSNVLGVDVGGAINKSANFLGENAAMLAKGTVGAIAAPIIAPEALVVGAGNFGSFLALADQFGKGGYTDAYKRTYYALKKQGLTDQEAADKAENVGLVGEATQLGVGAVLSSSLVPAPPLVPTKESSNAVVRGLSKVISKYVAPVADNSFVKMTTSSAASSLIESAAQSDAGVNLKTEDVLRDAINKGAEGFTTALSFWGLHQAAKGLAAIPSYIRPLMENVTASVPVEARENYLNKAVEQGIMSEEEKVKVSKTINQFGETKKPLNDLPISEEKKAAITGKLVQAKNIQEERDSLLKYGASFNDRVAQLDAQINEIHSDVNKMYAAEDVFALEQDRLTGEKPVTEPAVVMPNEVSRPAETTIAPDETLIPEPQENKGAAVILPQSNKEPNIINDESNRTTNTDNVGQVAEAGTSEGQQAIKQEDNNVSNERQPSEESKPIEAAANQGEQAAAQPRKVIAKLGDKIGTPEEIKKGEIIDKTWDEYLKAKPDTKVYDNDNLQVYKREDGNYVAVQDGNVILNRYGEVGRSKAVKLANEIGGENYDQKNYNFEQPKINKDASSKSEMQQQEMPESGGQGEHTRTVPQRNTEAVNETNSSNSLLGSEGRQKAKISRTKASSNLRNLSSKIREEGLLPNWAKADVPEGTQKMGFGGKELDEAVARSLELVADAIDAGKGFADSVNEGFFHIKDYYEKNTKSFDEKKLKQQFKENIKSRLQENRELSGITHAETENTRKEFALGGSHEKTVITDKELREGAIEKIKNGYDVNKLVSDLEKGKNPSAEENAILKLHKANLEAQIEKNPTDENLSQLRSLVKASDAAGSRQGRDLRSRQGLEIRDESLAGYFTREQDIHGDEPLSEQQKKQVIKEHTEISETQKKLEEKLAALEKENARIKAEKRLKEQSAKVTDKSKKTKEDFVKERNDILQSIKEKWKNAGKDNTLTAVPIPYAKQLAAIAPDVAKLVRSLVEEGVTKLADVTKNVHETLKESFPEITEKDVHDIIAGEYNPKKPTKTEITNRLAELRAEAKKQSGNKSPDATLKSIKARTQTEIKKLEEQLRTGNFEKEIKDPVKLDKEAIDLKDKLIKLRQEREVRIMKEEYDKMTAHQKDIDAIGELANVPRTLMSSVDYSAPLRQSVVATVAHPHIASKAAVEMFRQSISQKRFDRWFFDLKESPRYKLMEQSGLYVADPHDPRLTVKEEAFMNNLAEKIPFFGGEIKFTGDVNLRLPNKVTREGIEFGKKVKLGNLGDKGVKVPFTEKRIKSLGGLVVGSERAYVGYLNKMRVDLFNHFSDAFEARGFTFEKNPEIFKSIASFVNNSTGRGNLGPIESMAPILNSSFFSPRLIVSRFNLLGLSDAVTLGKGFYGKMPKEVRVMALKDMAKFVGTGLSVLGLLRLSSWASNCKDAKGEPCLTVEYDPRSTDFGKIKSGNTRWDIWGGMQQYVRIISQVIITGQSKSTRSGKIEELNGEGIFGETRGSVLGGFVRGKLAPIPSMAMDALTGRTAVGEKVNLKDEAMQHLLPLLTTDMEDALKDRGIKAILNVGIPSTFGVGVSTYLPRGYENVDVKKDPVFKFLYERNMQLSPPSLTNIPEDKVEAFTDKRQELFKKEWHNVLEYGAMIDSKGHPTTDARKGVKIKPKDALTYDDMAGLMKSISTKSARRAKKALGIETD